MEVKYITCLFIKVEFECFLPKMDDIFNQGMQYKKSWLNEGEKYRLD